MGVAVCPAVKIKSNIHEKEDLRGLGELEVSNLLLSM